MSNTQPLAIRLKPCPPRIGQESYSNDLSMIWEGSDLPAGLHNVLAGLEHCATEPRAASILCAKLFEAAPQLLLLAGDAATLYAIQAKQGDRDMTPAEAAAVESVRGNHPVPYLREIAARILQVESQPRTTTEGDEP